MNLQKHIIDEFGSDAAQTFYIRKAEEGLWNSEEKLEQVGFEILLMKRKYEIEGGDKKFSPMYYVCRKV